MFTGVITGVEAVYTLFLPEGTPLRATVTIHIREAEKVRLRRQAAEAIHCQGDTDCDPGRTCQAGVCAFP